MINNISIQSQGNKEYNNCTYGHHQYRESIYQSRVEYTKWEKFKLK